MEASRIMPDWVSLNVREVHTTSQGRARKSNELIPYTKPISTPALHKCAYTSEMIFSRINLIQSDESN